MRSLCMLFENHAAPLVMRLALSLPLHTQRNVTQRKRMSLQINRKKTRYRLFAPMRNAPPLAITCCLFFKKDNNSSVAKRK